MSGDAIVPFRDLIAKKQAEQASAGATEAVEQLLHAMEGMQAQIQSLTDLVISQDKRIRMLERAAKSKIITVAS